MFLFDLSSTRKHRGTVIVSVILKCRPKYIFEIDFKGKIEIDL